MTAWLPELEGWVKVLGAAVAVVMAVLVPVRSWIAEDRRYQARTLEALSAASDRAPAGVSPAPQLLADSLALGALAESLRDVASALRLLAAAGPGRDADRLARAVEAWLEGAGPRGGGR